MADFVGALDQGTTSTRFIVFDHDAVEVARAQLEHAQYLDRPGYVEHDPEEIWERTTAVIERALSDARLGLGDLAGIGIANQRETTVVWERESGRPVSRAIVWQDTRTEAIVEELVAAGHTELLRHRTGLPPTTYSSGTKLGWVLDHVERGRERGAAGELLFGTVDSWLCWKLTGRHVTDVSNASRTMLMNLETLDWDDDLLEIFEVPREMLGQILPSSIPAGELVVSGLANHDREVSVTGILGDQQSALVGQGCFHVGDTKNTYGTGNFLLVNTGERPVRSTHGLLSTVGYQFSGEAPHYALEGAIAVTGSAIQWLRDQLGVIASARDSEALAMSVADSEGLYFVPAFSGLFAPYWRSDARGTITGMTRAHTKAHLARATLEAIGFQSHDVVRALEADLGTTIDALLVDGGLTANSLCMQLQADILGVPVICAPYPETTALGAAFAAGLGAGLWPNTDSLPIRRGAEERHFEPTWDEHERGRRLAGWRRALERSLEQSGDETT